MIVTTLYSTLLVYIVVLLLKRVYVCYLRRDNILMEYWAVFIAWVQTNNHYMGNTYCSVYICRIRSNLL